MRATECSYLVTPASDVGLSNFEQLGTNRNILSTIIEVQTLLKMEMEIWKKLRLKAGKKKPEHRIRTLKLELGSNKH